MTHFLDIFPPPGVRIPSILERALGRVNTACIAKSRFLTIILRQALQTPAFPSLVRRREESPSTTKSTGVANGDRAGRKAMHRESATETTLSFVAKAMKEKGEKSRGVIAR